MTATSEKRTPTGGGVVSLRGIEYRQGASRLLPRVARFVRVRVYEPRDDGLRPHHWFLHSRAIETYCGVFDTVKAPCSGATDPMVVTCQSCRGGVRNNWNVGAQRRAAFLLHVMRRAYPNKQSRAWATWCAYLAWWQDFPLDDLTQDACDALVALGLAFPRGDYFDPGDRNRWMKSPWHDGASCAVAMHAVSDGMVGILENV